MTVLHSHLNITPIIASTASDPTVLESLVYWTRSAIGAEQGYKVNIKDVSKGDAPFDEKSGLGRNGSVSKKSKGGVSVGAESDVSRLWSGTGLWSGPKLTDWASML